MRKILYSVGIAGFLAMLIFTVATSLSNPFYGMTEAALAQSSSSSSGTGTGSNCLNQDCATACEEDHSKPLYENSREFTNTSECCTVEYYYFDQNGNLVKLSYTRYNHSRVCIDSDMPEYCFRCKEPGNNG